MNEILLVEDNVADVQLICERLLSVMGEQREIVHFSPRIDQDDLGLGSIDITRFELALVDLELGGTVQRHPGDVYGRTRALPEIRRQAPWIPVLLASAHLLGDPVLVAENSACGFDAVIPKDFFTASSVNSATWRKLLEAASFNRLGALTGRPPSEIRRLSETTIEISGVEELIDDLGRDRFKAALKLAGFTGTITFDPLEQGYSGQPVVHGHYRRDTREADWLFKFSLEPSKLRNELACHREVQLDGVTRRITVPPLWWSPVVWEGLALIAYEFESDGRTLLRAIRRARRPSRVRDSLCEALPAFRILYRDSVPHSINPASALSWCSCALSTVTGLPAQSIAHAFGSRGRSRELTRSVYVLEGFQHGDLHLRNIMLSDSGPTIIDFAHYRSMNGNGIPLLDLARLCVDLCISNCMPDIGSLLSGSILESSKITPILDPFLVDSTTGVSPDEGRLFRIAAECYLALHLAYDGIARPTKQRILSALQEHYT